MDPHEPISEKIEDMDTDNKIEYLNKNLSFLRLCLFICTATAAIFVLIKSYLALLIFVPLIIIIFILYNNYNEDLKYLTKNQAVPNLIKKVNPKSELLDHVPLNNELFNSSPFFEEHDYFSSDNHIKSSLGEFSIEIASVKTSKNEFSRKEKKEVDMFDGVFAVAKLPIKVDHEFAIFTNEILYAHDCPFTYRNDHKLEKIISNSQEFNQLYTFYSNRPDDKTELLTEEVITAILEETTELPANRIIYFYNNALYYCIKYNNFFHIFDGKQKNQLKATLSTNSLKYINDTASILYNALFDANH